MAPEERALAGHVSGAFYLIGALSLVPLIVLGDGAHENRTTLIALSCRGLRVGRRVADADRLGPGADAS